MRLRGLDRLYFTQVGSAERLTAPPSVGALLPRTLARSKALPPSDKSDEADTVELAFTDFPLPLPSWPRSVLIRQVVDFSLPRITELWLALYDGGRRSDVWHFQANPSLNGNKLLPNYWIEDTRAGPDGGVIVRLRGSMVRPQGAWWLTGKVVTLTAANGVLGFAHVRNAYGFNHAYDLGGETPPALDVNTEREVGGRFERRDLDPVPADVMKACGDPSDDSEHTWEELEAIAECVTRAPGSKVSSRTPQQPSFAERGY